MIYDRTDDANPPSLPPESNLPCIHSTNIPSDEVNTLIDENQDHETNYDDNYDGHPGNKMPNNGERIVLPSSVSRLVTDDVVMKEDATVEEKELENVSSNLDNVAATADTTADNIDNAEFQSSTVAVPTTTTTTTIISTEILLNKDAFLSNLIVVVAADDDIDNAKSSPKARIQLEI